VGAGPDATTAGQLGGSGGGPQMRILIAAVGRLKQGPERELAERYRKRAADFGRKVGLQAFDVVEIKESRADNLERRMLEESIAIANVIPERAISVILDERGSTMNSAAFAGRLQEWRTADRPAVVFILGGADGLAPSLRDKAELALAFGAFTWPHQLVRIMLLEQLYRAVTILGGHPYHRE
jgi:23S rRNA (pseudouridine1915-N3)-methyltransferase